MSAFADALKRGDLNAIRSVPKSDLHCHGMMGGRLDHLENEFGRKFEKFNNGRDGVEGINTWLGKVLRPLLHEPDIIRYCIEGAFLQAKSDGVTVFELSVDALLCRLTGKTPREFISILDQAHREIAPEIEFRPELGFPRSLPMRNLFSLIEPFLEFDFFRSVDLYDIEDAQPVENYIEFFRLIKRNGIRCKAHAGEFGDAESVRKTVELLDLDAVQHGIGAATSPEVMKWLADRGIPLNICPESNIALGRADSYSTHPIKILFDHGVRVTINTDDVMLFEKGNSEQYLDLFTAGTFTAEELDLIRQNGLSS